MHSLEQLSRNTPIVKDEMSARENLLTQHRAQFLALQGKHYFNYGGQGPMADGAIAALTSAQRRMQADGPFASAVNDWLQAEGHQTRAAIAATLGTIAETITLTENVTAGCNIPMWGLPWQLGDHILIGDCEHPGIVATVNEISRRYGVEVSTCALSEMLQGADPVALIQQALRPNTRLVVISHILWNTGQLLPLKEIVEVCHRNASTTRVLVDAAQSAGSLPLDQPGWTLPETEVDYYAFTGHKWLCGPAGLGALYVRPEVRDETAPTFIGWRSINVDGGAQPTGWKSDGRRYEVATSNYALLPALRAAMAVQAEWGSSAQRYARICELSKQLWEGLRSLPTVKCLLQDAPPPSGLVSFQIVDGQGNPAFALHSQLVVKLETQRTYLRTLQSPNCVRACVHYLSTESEVDALIEQIAKTVDLLR